MSTEIHVEPAHDDRHRTIGSHANEEQRRVLYVDVIMYIQQDREPSDRYANRPNGEQKSVPTPVAQHGNKHAKRKRRNPRRHGAQLRLDGRVVVALDDGGREVCVAVGRHDEAEVHQPAEPDAVVAHDGQHVAEGDAALGGVAAHVGLEARLDVGALVLAQPLGLLREGGEGEEEDDADDEGEDAFEDEDPTPA